MSLPAHQKREGAENFKMASKMAAKIANLCTKYVISLGRPKTFENVAKKGVGMDI